MNRTYQTKRGQYLGMTMVLIAGYLFFAWNIRQLSGAPLPLAAAALEGDVQGVRAALNRGERVTCSQGGDNALLLASLGEGENTLDVMQILLTHEANVNAATHNGNTPLLLAAAHGSSAVVGFLLAHGANVHARNVFGQTALKSAQAHGYTEIVPMLRQAGAGR